MLKHSDHCSACVGFDDGDDEPSIENSGVMNAGEANTDTDDTQPPRYKGPIPQRPEPNEAVVASAHRRASQGDPNALRYLEEVHRGCMVADAWATVGYSDAHARDAVNRAWRVLRENPSVLAFVPNRKLHSFLLDLAGDFANELRQGYRPRNRFRYRD